MFFATKYPFQLLQTMLMCPINLNSFMFAVTPKRDDDVIKHHLRATLTKLEGEEALLTLKDGQEIKWSKTKLPANLTVGESFYLVVFKEINTEKQKKELAKTILEEILNEG